MCRCCTNQTSIFKDCDNAKIGSYTLLTLRENPKVLEGECCKQQKHCGAHSRKDDRWWDRWSYRPRSNRIHTFMTTQTNISNTISNRSLNLSHTHNSQHRLSILHKKNTFLLMHRYRFIAMSALSMTDLWPLHLIDDTVTLLVPDHLPFKKLQWDD